MSTRKGDLAAALYALENLIAGSSTFQAATGADDATEAKAFVYWPGQKPYTEVLEEGEVVARTWPAVFAWVRFAEGAGIEVQECKPVVPVELWIQRRTPEGEVGNVKAESMAFLEFVGKIMQDMATLSLTAGNYLASRITLGSVMRNDEIEEEDYMEAVIRLEGMR
jgi:hypothetical protein